MKNPYLLLVLVFSMMMTNCGPGKTAVTVDPYLGAWRLLVEGTPQGNVSATMTINKNTDGTYSGSVNSAVGYFNLDDLKIDDNKLSAEFMIQGTEFDITGNFEKNLFKGNVSGLGDNYQTNGTKIVEGENSLKP